MSIAVPSEIQCVTDGAVRSFYLRDEQWRNWLQIVVFAVWGVFANCSLAFFNQVPIGWICLHLVGESVGCLLVMLPLFPCIRMDDKGVSIRRLWWWDTWLWQDFSDRSVQRGTGFFGYFRDDRVLRRRLRLDHLEDEDAVVLNDFILRHFRPSDEELIHSDCTFRVNWPDCRNVELTSTEIRIWRGSRQAAYQWSDVQRATIWHFDAQRADFKHLSVQLPGQYFFLERRIHSDNWTGCTAAEICAVVRCHVDDDVLQDYSLFGAPGSISELDARWARDWCGLHQQLQKMEAATVGFGFIGLLFVVAMFFFQDWFFLITTLLLVGLVGAQRYLRLLAKRSVARRKNRYDIQRRQLKKCEVEKCEVEKLPA